MNETIIWVPRANGKEITFQDGGKLLKLNFHVETLIAFLKQHVNEKGYINIKVQRRKEVGKYGETHSLSLDTWKPGHAAPATSPKTQQQGQAVNNAPPPEEDDVPF
jgi:hypothetical protein